MEAAISLAQRRRPATVRISRVAVGVVVGLLCFQGTAFAQSAIATADPLRDYLRILEIMGRAPLGSSFVRPTTTFGERFEFGTHPWAERRGSAIGGGEGGSTPWRSTGASLRTSTNTGIPFGWNDGGLWQGRGLSAGFDAGVELRWKALTARLHPEVTWSQNRAFDILPANFSEVPEFGYPWRVIDLPQRHGTTSTSEVRFGDSELRVDTRLVSFGLSTRNRWWGPGIRNAILLSDNAPGFAHGFVSTGRPLDLGPGTLEAFYLYGGLEQSDWFDPSVPGNERFLTGLVVHAVPDWPRGLSLGAARVVYGLVPDDGPSLGDFLLPFRGFRKKTRATSANPLGDDEEDQLLALFMRWALPGSGFEVYAEWARTDHAWDFRDFILEPEHAQGRTLGLRHSSPLTDARFVVIGVEVTDLARTPTSQVRDSPTYYEHWIVTQGYTHQGQIVGAGVGPGGSAQSVTVDLYEPWGRAGVLLERRVHDNDAFYYHAEQSGVDGCCHQVSFSAGPRLLLFRDDFEFEASSTITRQLNRYFQRGNDVWNLNLGFSARWRPSP